MKEQRDLETRLESWTPRRPSAKLKQNAWAKAGLAGTGAIAASTAPEFPSFRLGWLAPATMALLLSCVLFNQRNAAAFYGSADTAQLVAAAISNQEAATWLPGSFHRAQNRLPAETFEWTNGAGSTSSVGFLQRVRASY